MKNLIAIVLTMICMLVLSSGSAPTVAQEGEEPTLCDLIKQTRNKACDDAEEAMEEAGDDPEATRRAWRLEVLCMRLRTDYLEFCVYPE